MSELENDVQATEVAKRVKKVPTTEEIQAMKDAIALFASKGIISEKTAKVLELVENWHNTDANKEKKEEVIEFFGGVSEFKDYVEGEFTTELASVQALTKVFSVANSIRSFYIRRQSARTSKATIQVVIQGTPYIVNKAHFEAITGNTELSAEAKREAVLEHKDTRKAELMEI